VTNSKFTFPAPIIVLFFILAIGILLLYSIRNGQRDTLPRIIEAPPFTLIDQDGNVFSSETLKGYITVVNFIFTSCGGICPVMTFQMQQLHQRFDNTQNVRFISITVDPERDTPDVLKSYAKGYDADLSRWIFLTGGKDEIFDISRKGYLLGVESEGGTLTEPILHSQKFVLVDNEGFIRGYFDGFDDNEIEELYRYICKTLNRIR
jgi:protein SCO1